MTFETVGDACNEPMSQVHIESTHNNKVFGSHSECKWCYNLPLFLSCSCVLASILRINIVFSNWGLLLLDYNWFYWSSCFVRGLTMHTIQCRLWGQCWL